MREGGTESWKSESKARFTIMLHCPTMPCRVAKCHEDRNGFHPRDAAKRQGATGAMRHIVNLLIHSLRVQCNSREEVSNSKAV